MSPKFTKAKPISLKAHPEYNEKWLQTEIAANEQRPVGDRITDDGFATVNAPHLVALVRADAVFDTGTLVEGPDESEGDQRVA